MDTRRLLLVIALALTVALAGCVGLGDADDAGPGEIESGADVGDDAPAVDESFESDSVADSDPETSFTMASADDGARAALAAERQLIRTGELRVTVEEFADADDEARRIVESYDGFVSERARETRERDGEEYVTGELVVRVPSDEFDATMADLEALGEVDRSATESEDVGERIADLEARLENREAERDRLRDLYEEANTTEDVLAVQSELADVQSEVERLDTRLDTLAERVALATIRVALSEEPPKPESEEPESWYETGVSSAFLESVSGVGTALRAAVVGAAYAAPYLLTVGIPVALVGAVVARRVDLRSIS